MNKNVIRLTESQLMNIIRESVKKLLKENENNKYVARIVLTNKDFSKPITDIVGRIYDTYEEAKKEYDFFIERSPYIRFNCYICITKIVNGINDKDYDVKKIMTDKSIADN